MIAITNILVATDFSEASDKALSYGKELARKFSARLHVIHVVGVVTPDMTGAAGYVPDLGSVQTDLEETADRQLAALVSDEDRQGLKAKIWRTTSNSPASAITAYAKDETIDLVVMGTHGRSAVARWILGSVADKVVRTAPCPVLTVRHPEHDFVIPDALQRVETASHVKTRRFETVTSEAFVGGGLQPAARSAGLNALRLRLIRSTRFVFGARDHPSGQFLGTLTT